MTGVASFLVSGSDRQLGEFHLHVAFMLNAIDRRGDTVRYTCLEEDRDVAIQAATESGVTMEEIIMEDGEESYEMVVNGEHPGWQNRDRSIYG